MRVILLIACVLFCAVRAPAQEPAADADALPVLPDAAPAAAQEPELPQPEAGDPVDRLESRLDRIERRLDQQGAGNETVEPQVLPDPAAAPADAGDWRYRFQDGVWWYWLPSNRWVYWSNGRWVDHFPDTTRTTVLYRSAVTADPYFPSYSYRYPRSLSSYSLYDYGYPRLYSSYGLGYPRLYSSYNLGYPRFYSSYGLSPTYHRSFYGGYGGYGGWGSAIGLGLSIGHSLGHHHHHGHFHSGHHHFGHHHHGHHGHHGHRHHHHH